MDRFSPLYSRYNGFTLGMFVTAAGMPFARRRYGAFRTRMQEFSDEAELGIALPKTHASFARRAEEIRNAVLAAAGRRAELLRDFVGIGAMAVLHGSGGSLVSDELAATLRDRWLPVLERHGVGESTYDTWIQSLPRGDRGLLAEDFLSPATALITELLVPVDPEPETCFVAMPFHPPFTRYFTEFYRPALERTGLRVIRAWGGVSSEEYYIMLLTLISRCGCMLAELTGLNLNVVNEVGIAHGMVRPVFMIGDRTLKHLPSNLAYLANFTYPRRGRHWMRRAEERLAEFVEWMLEDYHRRYALAHPEDVER